MTAITPLRNYLPIYCDNTKWGRLWVISLLNIHEGGLFELYFEIDWILVSSFLSLFWLL